MSVCLFVRTHISETTRPNFTVFSVLVDRGRGSVLLWRHSNKLCTSGFVADVVSYNGPYAGVTLSQQPRFSVVYTN